MSAISIYWEYEKSRSFPKFESVLFAHLKLRSSFKFVQGCIGNDNYDNGDDELILCSISRQE